MYSFEHLSSFTLSYIIRCVSCSLYSITALYSLNDTPFVHHNAILSFCSLFASLHFLYLRLLVLQFPVLMIVSSLPRLPSTYWNQYSSVSIVTSLRAGLPRNRGSIPGRSKRFFSSPQRPDRLWDPHTQPSIQCVQGALSQEVKRPGPETDQSPPSSFEVKIL
jgi:hypothetical protein